ncbi:hypothetical protein B0T16DRAFT_63551 [Cercophora newfieldiana]|uniref:Uncharacterized protein n=1 Tax=Cercophora newfieldiana TaxID=92897 RepID=A0AA39YTX5_9PEZI|nr:hypothetical protein B0T16DRAFT_63551 [Cercophora newfieldiana]
MQRRFKFGAAAHRPYYRPGLDDDNAWPDMSLRGGNPSEEKEDTYPAKIIPNKPPLTFAQLWEKNNPYRGASLITPTPKKIPDPVNPDPDVYLLGERDPRRRAKIEMLGYDEVPLMPKEGDNEARVRDLWYLKGKSGSWRPTRLDLQLRWPLIGELGTAWYRMMYVQLHLRVVDFVEAYFGHGDLPERPGAERLWREAKMGETFLHYAQLVCRQDNACGGWEAVLRERGRRVSLVVGVLTRILHTEVFDAYLFGADEKTAKMFRSYDDAMVQNDGYTRTSARSQSIRTILAGDAIPEKFWDSVDDLAYQMTKTVLPLLQLMDKKFGVSSRQHSSRKIYQDMHHIVSQAGFLSVGIRWSCDIFRFSWPVPGMGWELDMEEADDSIFKRSKKANDEREKLAKTKWDLAREKLKLAQETSATAPPPSIGMKILNALASALQAWMAAGEQEKLPTDPDTPWMTPSYLAKIHIALLPTLQRFSTGTIHARRTKAAVADGEAIDLVQKGRVVYYLGRVDDESDHLESKPKLEVWAKELRPLGTVGGIVDRLDESLVRALPVTIILLIVVPLLIDTLERYTAVIARLISRHIGSFFIHRLMGILWSFSEANKIFWGTLRDGFNYVWGLLIGVREYIAVTLIRAAQLIAGDQQR